MKGEDEMKDVFLTELNNYEKEMYQKHLNHKNTKGICNANQKRIISPLNDLLMFNPFQYEPYYKLTKQTEYPKAIYIADEVGAGKTIEAGIILTELIYQNEINLLEDICLIVCPNLLCRKWRDTLKSLFGIGSSIVYSIEDIGIGINILSYDTVSKYNESKNMNLKLLIMDEAHNASGDRYRKIYSIRKKVNEKEGYVVLLSATPLCGNKDDEKKQLNLLNENLNVDNFFRADTNFLCKNKKVNMRYAVNPEKYQVNVSINNHYVKNEALLSFRECCKEIFRSRNTILQFQGLDMIMSSPEAGLLFMERLLEKNDDELLEYLQSSNEKSDMDCESEDDEDYEDIEYKEYTLEDVQRIRKEFNEIRHRLSKIKEGIEKDKKFEELINLIKVNKDIFDKKEDEDASFYNHIIIFTNRLSTAKYLEERLNKQQEIPCKTFRVTGELFESEKRARLVKYENVKDMMSILIITNVACEGQDMDYGNTIVNYDLDYNPVRLEQRRGRIDRFEVKKDRIYIHNFMVAKYDYDLDNLDDACDEYSKVLKIWNKIDEIKNLTGTYYEILKCDENRIEDKRELENNRQNIFKHISELGGIEDTAVTGVSSLYESVQSSCRNQFGNYKDEYELISDRLIDLNIIIEENDDKQIVIKTLKNNQDFLNNVYIGGTLISHLIFGGK